MGVKKQTGRNVKQQVNPDTISGGKAQQKVSSDKGLFKNMPKLLLYQRISVFIVAFLAFANSIPNGYNIDDIYYTTKGNPVTSLGIKAIPIIFSSHTLHDPGNPGYDYRPVAAASFALQHQFIGDAPAISHFISVLLYAIICLLFFILLCHWFGNSKSWFVFFVVLLYSVHPLHTEVVDSIKNRDELLATLFGLLSMLAIWKWYGNHKNQYIVLSVFLFVVGLMCKTTVIIYVIIVPIVFYFFTSLPLKKIISSFVVLFLTYFLFAAIVTHYLPEQKRVFLYFENPMFDAHLPIGIKTATISYILGWYAYLHVIPYPLSFYYGYSYVSLMDWRSLQVILSVVPYLLLVYFVIKNIREKSVAVFGALYYLVCMLLFSNIVQPAAGMMAERFTFDSSLGYCILVVSVLFYLYKITPGAFSINEKGKYLVVTFLFIFTGYSAMSISRNTQWRNYWTLYTNDIQHLQNSVEANMLYGDEVTLKYNLFKEKYMYASGPEKSLYRDSLLECMERERTPYINALAVAPYFNKAMNNLAVAYIHVDSLEEAKKYLFQARNLPPFLADVHYNLGLVYGMEGSRGGNEALIDSAIKEYKIVIDSNPKYQKAYWRIDMLYLTQKDTAAALSALRSGIKNIPDQSFLYTEIARVYLYRKDTTTAVNYLEQGAEVPHPDLGLLQFLQGYYFRINNIQKLNYYRDKASANE